MVRNLTDLNTVVRETSLRRQLIQSVEGNGSDVKPEMYVFVTSNKAYGAAVYICNRNESRLVISKNICTRVSTQLSHIYNRSIGFPR
ncbi:hypothetical protein DPMN_089394 [Dreissena polymorpha]|uniref:Uncharacterized protein n=1 Tax=Dreissena polymorpha TaxID=45954 RepID=A0A9D4QYT7_DREPO|nr:hypothetical protein DPMN_089394 [Dreissena polymorpha]